MYIKLHRQQPATSDLNSRVAIVGRRGNSLARARSSPRKKNVNYRPGAPLARSGVRQDKYTHTRGLMGIKLLLLVILFRDMFSPPRVYELILYDRALLS